MNSVNRRDFLRRAGGVMAGLGALSLMPADALLAASAAPASAPASVPASAPTSAPFAAPRPITIYKDPNCGCCKKWVEHVQAAGFTPTVHDTADMATVKASMGVPESLHSCHTAKVGNYVIEGHVPADLIDKLLREQPVARGLAVPGMPMGSPGMEGPSKDKYSVMLFDKSGKSRVYASR